MNRNDESIPTLEQWQTLPTAMVAAWVRQRGAATVAVVEGTRRWYQFTHLRGAIPPPDQRDYMLAGGQAHVDLIRLLLEHGLAPLYIPLIMPLDRGANYVRQMLAHGMPLLLDHPDMEPILAEVRVRTYGAWPELPADWTETKQALDKLCERFATLEASTRENKGPALYFHLSTGPQDPLQALLKPLAKLQLQQGSLPSQTDIIRKLYQLDEDEEPEQVKLFLSSELQVSRYIPPLLGGVEEPYFTTDSLLGLNALLLRRILYDYVFLRHGPPGANENDLERYDDLSVAQRSRLAEWQQSRQGQTIGLGTRHEAGGFWYPWVANRR